MDVIFYEAFEEEAEAIQGFLPENISAKYFAHTIQEAKNTELKSDFISLRTQSQIPQEWSGKLNGILTRSTGYDHLIRYKEITNGSQAYGYLPLYCAQSVAEHCLLVCMTLLKNLPRQTEQFKKFHRDGITSKEVKGKKLVVFGVGNIGVEIFKLGTGLGMECYAVDSEKKFSDVTYLNWDEGLETADVIVCAMDLNDTNVAAFNYQRLSTIKETAIFINISRGEISPSQDLLKLLKEKKLAGLGLDVFNFEDELSVALRQNIKSNNPEVKAVLEMNSMENVILTPHNGFNTEESVLRKAEQSVQQIISFLDKREFIWSVPGT